MKFILGLILVAISAFLVSYILPWWGIALIAFLIAAVIGIAPWKSFLYGLIGTMITWGIVTFITDYSNESLLSKQIAELFQLSSSTLLIIITTIIGGFTGGLGALTGSTFRQLIFNKNKKNRGYRKRKKRLLS